MYGYAMYMPALFSHKSGYINISLLFFGLSGILVVFPVIRVFTVNLGTGPPLHVYQKGQKAPKWSTTRCTPILIYTSTPKYRRARLYIGVDVYLNIHVDA